MNYNTPETEAILGLLLVMIGLSVLFSFWVMVGFGLVLFIVNLIL